LETDQNKCCIRNKIEFSPSDSAKPFQLAFIHNRTHHIHSLNTSLLTPPPDPLEPLHRISRRLQHCSSTASRGLFSCSASPRNARWVCSQCTAITRRVRRMRPGQSSAAIERVRRTLAGPGGGQLGGNREGLGLIERHGGTHRPSDRCFRQNSGLL